jgi:hypothetical protein
LAVVVAGLVVSTLFVRAQQAPRFIIHLPDTIDVESCPTKVLLEGNRWSYSHPLQLGAPDAHTLTIPTIAWDGRQAQRLKAVVWCSGHGAALVSVPSLEQSKYETSIAPPSLKSLPVTGHVVAEHGESLAGLELRVSLAANWICTFFDLGSCLVPTFQISRTRIGHDGSFAFEVPDIAGDQAIAPLNAARSGFSLSVGTAAPVGPHYLIESATWEFPVAASYPSPLTLRAIRLR